MIDDNAVFTEILEYTKIAHDLAIDINNGDKNMHKLFAHKHIMNILGMLEPLRNESVLLKNELELIETE